MRVCINDREYTLDHLWTKERKLISIGRLTDAVCNAIAIDDERFDVYQCQIVRDESGAWLVHDGQYRTECPKGLKAARDVACSLCRGRCMNARVANPTYSWRTPSTPTLIDGNPIEGYVEIADGAVISVKGCVE